MRPAWILFLVIGLLGATASAQFDQLLFSDPPCDSQRASHRTAIEHALAIHDAIQEYERTDSERALVALGAVLETLNSVATVCLESNSGMLFSMMKLVAVGHEKLGVRSEIGNSDDLAPLLAKWQAWATAFVSEEFKTQFWLGSFSNYQGRGIEVGCLSYLLPVDTGAPRGRNTLAELSLALSALFDPQRRHPDGDVETEDWIKDLGLTVAGIHIDEGFAEIALGGPLRGIGTCGDAILEAQILQTVFQFSDIERARIAGDEMNLRQIVDMSDRLSREELEAYIYDREDVDWLRD